MAIRYKIDILAELKKQRLYINENREEKLIGQSYFTAITARRTCFLENS